MENNSLFFKTLIALCSINSFLLLYGFTQQMFETTFFDIVILLMNFEFKLTFKFL